MFTALNIPISTCEYYDDKHGYQVHRRVELYVNNAQLPKGWKGINRLIKVRRWGHRAGKPFEEVSFYVLSKKINSARIIANAVQGHWSVENNLHWVKDVNLNEDFMTLKKPKNAAILAFLNNIAFNAIAMAGLKPTKDNFAIFSNKVNELNKLFINF